MRAGAELRMEKEHLSTSAAVQRFIPNLFARPVPSSRHESGEQQVFLQQGDLDAGCGIYCLLMAMMIRTGLRRSKATRVLRWPRSPLTYSGQDLATRIFTGGSEALELAMLAREVQDGVVMRIFSGSHSSVLQSVQAEIESGNPTLLNVHDRWQRHRHWVVVTGIEYLCHPSGPARETASALLALDPAQRSGAPQLRAFNWRLELSTPRKGARYLRSTADDSRERHLTCVEALAVRTAAKQLLGENS
jgi:hypothetical protein